MNLVSQYKFAHLAKCCKVTTLSNLKNNEKIMNMNIDSINLCKCWKILQYFVTWVRNLDTEINDMIEYFIIL